MDNLPFVFTSLSRDGIASAIAAITEARLSLYFPEAAHLTLRSAT